MATRPDRLGHDIPRLSWELPCFLLGNRPDREERKEVTIMSNPMSDEVLTSALEEVLASFSTDADEGLTEREYELARVTKDW